MNNSYTLDRYPASSDRSLKAWSAADEHILKSLASYEIPIMNISIINDRFGFLAVHLNKSNPTIITHFKSQEDAILTNIENNKLDSTSFHFSSILDDLSKFDFVVLKIPKSLDLFHLFIAKVHQLSNEKTKILCGFMTRHFTKQMIEIANQYFENIEQGLAWKKSRVLTLSSPKKDVVRIEPKHAIEFKNHREESHIIQQYYGVFSAKHIDYATQLLIEYLKVDPSVNKALDLACGNGVIGHEIRLQSDSVELHLLDDSYLAIESAKLNLKDGPNHFHYAHNLDHFEDGFFDLVVCNPPFHFEYENTIDIALSLFEGVSRILSEDGSFILVSNLHLNYKTHLTKIFGDVEVIAMNSKFEVIRCKNSLQT